VLYIDPVTFYKSRWPAGPASLSIGDGMTDNQNPFACYDRRFGARVIVAALVLVALALTSRALGLERGSAARIAFAVAEVVVLGYTIAITVGSIRKLDEMQYRVQLEAIAFAFASSAIVITGWGFLAKAGLPSVSWGPETWMVMVLLWALGLWLVRRRYQ